MDAKAYKLSVEKDRSELMLRVYIAEQTTQWIHRFGGPRVLTAMREWLDYMDRVVALNDGSECGDE